MKSIYSFCLILLFSTPGCFKSDSANVEPVENSVIGKWTYIEYYYSTGAPGQWHTVSPAGQTIEFKPDGKFISTGSFLKDAAKYEIIDSATIKFQPASTPSGYTLMGYMIKTAQRELQTYPVNPMCIEGCSNKFRR